MTMTAIALEPVLIKQVIERFGRNCVPPDLAQLCVQTIVLFGPVMRTVAPISLVRTLILWSRVVEGVRACMNAFMFVLASLMPARFLRYCA